MSAIDDPACVLPVNQIMIDLSGNQGAFYFDDFAIDGSVIDDFEDGNVSEWDVHEFDSDTTWNATTATASGGSFSGHLEFDFTSSGHQWLTLDVEPGIANEYSFWVNGAELTRDDTSIKFRNTVQDRRAYLFAVDLTRETTGNVHVFGQTKGTSEWSSTTYDTNQRLPTDEWVQCRFVEVDFQNGSGRFVMERAGGETFIEQPFEFKGSRSCSTAGAVEPGELRGLVWDTAADWDAAVDSSGIVHEAVANTDHVDAGVSKQGYSIADPTPSAGLVGYWPFQEMSGGTAYDHSGHGKNGVVNGPAQGSEGILGTTAYAFDGTDDMVVVPDFEMDVAGTTGWTYLAWVSPHFSPDETRNQFVYHWTAGGNDNWALSYIGEGTWRWEWSNTNPTARVSFSPGSWHMIAGTVTESGRYTGYWNGDPVTSDSVGSCGGTADLTIGSKFDGTKPLDASLGPCLLYDRALSGPEIRALYDVVVSPGTITTDAREASQ